MPPANTLDHMTPEQREKHLKEVVDRKRKQRGTADHALKVIEGLDVPLKAHDEIKALRHELRDVIHDKNEDIDSLRKRLHKLRQEQKPDGGPDAAVKWALSQVGVTEMPAGSNWGHPVQDYIIFTGYGEGVPHPPWCGCFVCTAVVQHGGAAIAARIRLGYGPAIIADANAHVNGLVAVPFLSAQPGDILSLWGGEHIALVRGKPAGATIPTCEGNTSPVQGSGSEYNGGCVAAKTRLQSDISVVARPAYPH